MRYYLIAGESSGDLHGSNLMKSIVALDAEAEFRFWGGDLMSSIGGKPVKHIRELAFMGFVEVLSNLRTILRNLKLCKKDILSWKPDVVILIDYPGFNMRIGEFVHLRGIRVAYYITPQIWAWKQNRAYSIGRMSDRILTILPFEKDFFARFGIESVFVGHPLLDAMNIQHHPKSVSERPIVALLPGSRRMEIAQMLPVLLETSKNFTECRFIIAGAPSIPQEYYNQFTNGYPVEVQFGKTYEILAAADAALVTSGTATLETALSGVPQVVCYKGNPISYRLARYFIKVPYISLVNLIADKQVVKELIQHEMNPEKLSDELKQLLYNQEYRTNIIDSYKKIRRLLGNTGASLRAAQEIVDLCKAS